MNFKVIILNLKIKMTNQLFFKNLFLLLKRVLVRIIFPIHIRVYISLKMYNSILQVISQPTAEQS